MSSVATEPATPTSWHTYSCEFVTVATQVRLEGHGDCVSQTTHCHADTSSYSVAQRIHCLVFFLACYGSKLVLRISWARGEERANGNTKASALWVKVVWPTKEEFMHLLKAFVLKGKYTVIFLKKDMFLSNSGLYSSRSPVAIIVTMVLIDSCNIPDQYKPGLHGLHHISTKPILNTRRCTSWVSPPLPFSFAVLTPQMIL